MSHIGPLVCWLFVALHVARRHLGALYINLEQCPHICHSASLEVDFVSAGSSFVGHIPVELRARTVCNRLKCLFF